MEYYKQNARLHLIASILFVCVFLIVFTISAFFINDQNIIKIKIVDCVLFSFSSCFMFYSFVNVINPCKRKINHIYTVLNSSKKHLTCEVVEVKKIKTISKNVVAQQLFVKCDDLELFINYNLDCKPRKFNVGSKIEVDVADSFITNEDK